VEAEKDEVKKKLSANEKVYEAKEEEYKVEEL